MHFKLITGNPSWSLAKLPMHYMRLHTSQGCCSCLATSSKEDGLQGCMQKTKVSNAPVQAAKTFQPRKGTRAECLVFALRYLRLSERGNHRLLLESKELQSFGRHGKASV